MRKTSRFSTSVAGWAIVAAFSSTSLWAQETAPAAESEQVTTSDETGDQIEAIVVTARRLEENLQRAPVSVSALSATTLDNMNIRGVEQAARLVPNVSSVEQSNGIGGNVVFIRGIGLQDALLTIDAPVGVYMDGVYLGRQASNNFDLVDPERIEVLRGPQGTLFGRNTTGGAVSIISKRPPSDFGGELKLGYASLDDFFAKAAIDTGDWGSSGLSSSFALSYRQRNGFVDAPGTPKSREEGAVKSTAGWAKIHGDWGALTLDISGDFNIQNGQRNPFQIVDTYEPANTYFTASPTYGGEPFVVATKLQDTLPLEYAGRQHSKTYGVGATIAYEFSPALTVKSITAWRGWNAESPTAYAGTLLGPVVDLDSPNLYSIQRVTPFVAYDQDLRQRQFSQELQILGRTDTLSYVGGVYYFNERAGEYNSNDFTVALPTEFLGAFGFPAAVGDAILAQGVPLIGVNLGQVMEYTTKSESLAGFGQVSWKPAGLDDKLEVTGGIRYTHDKRFLDQTSTPAASPIGGQLPNPVNPLGPSRTARESYSNWSYLGSLSYQWADDFMTYARITTGYKSGGFDARAGFDFSTGLTLPLTFDPEKATAYEVGFKSELADRHVRLNGALFYTKYKNLQIPQYSGGNGFVPNANAHYQGFELEATVIPINHVQLDASMGYVDPVYDELILVDPATGLVGDYKREGKFLYVPKVTLHLGGQYLAPLGFAKLLIRGDYTYSSKRYFFTTTLLNPLNEALADPGQNLVSARIALTDIAVGSALVDIGLFGDNLLNVDKRLAAVDFGPSIGIGGVNFGQPRRFGVDARIKF